MGFVLLKLIMGQMTIRILPFSSISIHVLPFFPYPVIESINDEYLAVHTAIQTIVLKQSNVMWPA
jgi:hypothetical protein